MAEPTDEIATAQDRGRGELRASNSDREQVVDALKTAFTEGRLTSDEFGVRLDEVYASLTYAELGAVLADIPTALTESPSRRAPWRATKRAGWFEYAAFLPGIVALILLPGGPRTTVWTLVLFGGVIYPVFWLLGAGKKLVARFVKPLSEQQVPPPCLFDRDQATRALKTALMQGRLTDEEHDTRVAQASASRSRSELAALTADLPADLASRLPTPRDAWTGAFVSIVAASVFAALMVLQPDNMPAFLLGMLTAALVLLAPPVTVGLIVDARHQRRTRQLRLGPIPSASG